VRACDVTGARGLLEDACQPIEYPSTYVRQRTWSAAEIAVFVAMGTFLISAQHMRGEW